MVSEDIQARIGPAIVDYSENGAFPEEETLAAASVGDSVLPAALKALNDAKLDLETEIRNVSRETIPDVESWMTNARAVQEDIERSRRLATEIVREAEADEGRLEYLEDRKAHVEFLEKELLFNQHLGEALQRIQQVNDTLDRAERVAGEKNILEALGLLAEAWEVLDKIPVERTARAIRLLVDRSFDLRSFIREQLADIWANLVHWVNHDTQSLTIREVVNGDATNIGEAITSWKSFKELDTIAKQFWEDLDVRILTPRIDIRARAPSSILIQDNTLSIGQAQADTSVKSLFQDLENIVRFLVQYLPNEFVKSLSSVMMPILFTRIKEQWLDSAVPSSLDDMGEYQKTLVQVHDFAAILESLDWPAADGFYDWVSNAHRIWLVKRKETTLDWTRNQLALGLGAPLLAQHSEKKMVARDEGVDIAQTGTVEVSDWDAGWESDEKDESEIPSGMNRASVEEERRASETYIPQLSSISSPADLDDDAADAWGWGDDDIADEPVAEPNPAEEKQPSKNEGTTPEMREVTLSEPYWTSSIPKPVFDTINVIYHDGAELTKPENEQIPVAPAAAGLFSLPTQVLAMYRSISPYYYSQDASGNMYAYNDSIWLCDKLREFAASWESREDLAPRARGLVKLNPDIEKLASFGKRAYTNELTSQRTIINDFLGGARSFLEDSTRDELEQGIETVILHIRKTSEMWKKILSYSAWASAVGSLVNTVAKKIISGVFDRDNLGVEEANLVAELIVKVTQLDDLFIPESPPSNGSGARNGSRKGSVDTTGMALGSAPLTARFADKWWKMQYLGEVLQSNLANIRFLWFETGLSLEFTKEEVIDLILLSFENNAQVRGLIKEIKESEVKEVDE